MDDEMVLFLVKIGQSKYLKNLYEKGEIYMQTQSYFKQLEDIPANVHKSDQLIASH